MHRQMQPFSGHAVRTCLAANLAKLDKVHQRKSMASFSGRNADSDLAGGGSSVPQPTASNSNTSSSNTPCAAPISPDSNSSSTSPSTNGSQPSAKDTSELSKLKDDVSKLSELVTNQARMLQDQMKDLEHARSLIDMHALKKTLNPPAPTETIKAGWNKDVKPFEVQRNAIGDRRYLGGYDARFHSTNL